jgi:hypothetical protein
MDHKEYVNLSFCIKREAEPASEILYVLHIQILGNHQFIANRYAELGSVRF